MNAPRLAVTLLLASLAGLLLAALDSSPSARGQEGGGIAGFPVFQCAGLDDSYEHNDSMQDAVQVKLPFSEADLISCVGDSDWYAFSAPAGTTLHIGLDFDSAQGVINYDLADPSGAIVASGNGGSSLATFASGIWSLRIYLPSDPNGFGNLYDLDLSITCPPAGVFDSTFEDALEEPFPISDKGNLGTVDCLTIEDTRTINDLMVGVAIDHFVVGQLIVTLEHVDTGTRVTLIDLLGYPGAICTGDDIFVTLSDGGALPAEGACAQSPPAVSGTLRPLEPLSAFDGESVEGTWRLHVSDHFTNGIGTLNSWSLVADLTAATPPPEPSSTNEAQPTNTPVPPTATTGPGDPTPTATATAEKALGDVNDDGSVNAIDAALVLQLAAGLLDALPNAMSADVNESGAIDAVDAALILQFSAGLLPALPP
jgi:subtilisin-like proprotein convertase family protein